LFVRLPVAVLLAVLLGGQIEAADGGGTLRLATCQLPVSADVTANGVWVRTQIRRASDWGADLIHFPEYALSGYAGVDLPSVEHLDWDALRRETEAVLALVRELKVWVVLGSTHRLSGDHKPHNCLYVISPEGKVIDRYDKRFCTGGDLKHYSPGNHFVTFDVHGVRCGLLICYDIRFPELYRAYCERGVRLMLHSFYNARQKEESIHPKIMPVTAQAYAGVNNMFVSINNSSAPRSWPSRLITPDGLIVSELPTDEPGVMVNVVDVHKPYYDASGPFRSDAIRGKLNSGEVVADPRSESRTDY
jgi:predicted amidohydrolase